MLKYSIGEEGLSNYDEEDVINFMVDLIKKTEKAEEYLKSEKMIKNGYGPYIILAAGKAEEYLNEPEKYKDIELSVGEIVELM